MKWIFLLVLLMLVPILSAQFRSNPKALLWAGVAIGFLPFGMAPLHLYVAPVSWPAWQGSVKGIEISLLDGIALAIILSTKRVRLPTSIVLAFSVYFAAVMFSTMLAHLRMPAAFYVWQLMRTALVCVGVAKASATSRQFPMRILVGGGIGLAVEAVTTASQYLHGHPQAGGTFAHPNSLSMATHFVIFPAVALLLGGRRPLLAVGIIACEAIVVLTGGSRAGTGLFAGGLILTILLSIWHRTTGRKVAVAVSAAVCLALATPAFFWAVNRRSEAALESSNEERAGMILAARMMIADHPLGVGANQYVVTANLGGYSDRAGISWTFGSRAAPVHNSYYLVAAELGIFGFISLVGLLVTIIAVGLRAIKRGLPGERSDLMVGVVASLIIVAIHCAFEWIAMVFFIHYLFAIAVGIMIGVRRDAELNRNKQMSSGQRQAEPTVRALTA